MQSKYESLSPIVLLQPLPIPTQVWNDISMDLISRLPIPTQVLNVISMDFISGLQKAMGHETILVVVNRFIKYSHFLLLSIIHIQQRVLLHQLFVRLYISIMVFPYKLCLNEIGFLSDNFCKNYSSCVVLASN